MYYNTLEELKATAAELLVEAKISFYKLAVNSDLIHVASGSNVARESKVVLEDLVSNFDQYLKQAKGCKSRQLVPIHPRTAQVRKVAKEAYRKAYKTQGGHSFAAARGIDPKAVYRKGSAGRVNRLDWYLQTKPAMLSLKIKVGTKLYDLTNHQDYESARQSLHRRIVAVAVRDDLFRLGYRAVALPGEQYWVCSKSILSKTFFTTNVSVEALANVGYWLDIESEFLL